MTSSILPHVAYAVFPGDCLAEMEQMPDGLARTIVTSPPYWSLRDYGSSSEVGAESDPPAYVEALVAIFREARRVLADDGTFWLNLGDSYAKREVPAWGLKPKDMLGLPWRVAMALQADGWTLRSDVIWHKPKVMPTSIRDRLTPAHEYVFLFAKSPRYHFDYEAILEPYADARQGADGGRKPSERNRGGRTDGFTKPSGIVAPNGGKGRRKRSVWAASNNGLRGPWKGEHLAVYPPAIVEPCVLAGSGPGDVVLDPFTGSGTTGVVAVQHGRRFVGCELNERYASMALDRIDEAYMAAGQGFLIPRESVA